MHCLQYILLLILFHISLIPAQTDTFDEELMLKPLPNGHVYAYFQFTTLWETQNNVNTSKYKNMIKLTLFSTTY